MLRKVSQFDFFLTISVQFDLTNVQFDEKMIYKAVEKTAQEELFSGTQ